MLQQLIKHEISKSNYNIREDVQSQALRALEDFYNDIQNYQDTKNAIMRLGINVSVFDKIARIKESYCEPPLSDQHTYQHHRKAIPWTESEDVRLIAAVLKYSASDWKVIASYVGCGRNSSQCNLRWNRVLNPYISNKSWSHEEDMKLLSAVQMLGRTAWNSISKMLPGRTDAQCRLRYLFLSQSGGQSHTSRSTKSSENSEEETEIPRKRRPSITIAPSLSPSPMSFGFF
ncbi:Myb-like DNA-binding domain containing protein [Trichomonas vaginalis G3]|uniref:Myb-like DNA-binding domain containing protein n=1 Tax=Trichomonas vaginalis (strain ATCC PRA-98 / G3) TaxID=412133 RepID=A2E7E1_TRIV3|nr:RNA polymerase II transcription regulator recruiting protein [Trichomonas vaginalis G3]EAY11434.1 Myb-like DNA-binding domain containing protein [Trichomonas vaginalis G3]KAI5498646.1 RNA polymerase II transcription regulator recruiting protein [Trichomonas vaginalis G3]|eukprot:XP_001323657.1 Myb-like DNA-binding domain containing protein [Trichomonas vaginalis G3]